ncbi:alpha/beta fold hydrolase [Pseudooceanicola sp. 216_PA32_1]|uniref:Alpha/beta fold hydrolase n=1 Tax=Pseudooceanicola pacificus TaxID=2676438 RepID=A0A844W5A0_9RHOB|nr:alpha/beta fold hydrolase [Pseudooceanicola pacificus]MWB77894.1 alpha/beta fold hydrolase [Pseudooceanicola pacificus]
MPEAQVNGITIYYEVEGPDDGKPILLITGVGTQMTRFPKPFVDKLVARGYRVIRMDNRDIGLSQKFTDHGLPDFKEAMAAKAEGRQADLAYQLSDFAADGAALLDHLGIDKAHVAGFSMGGMIVQLMAIEHPDKVLSMASIMSNTANPDLPKATPEAMAALTTPRPDANADLDAFVAHGVASAKVIGSPAWPIPDDVLAANILSDYERSYHPTGFPRQYAAILATYDRRPFLQKLKLPCVAIHGVQDPLVPVEGGRDTAANIPGCELVEIDGMGHNLPPQIFDRIIDAMELATLKA